MRCCCAGIVAGRRTYYLLVTLKRDGTAFAIPSTNLLHVPTWAITKPEGTVIYVYADKPEPMDDGGVRFTTEQDGSRVVVDEFDADSWSSYMQSGTP